MIVVSDTSPLRYLIEVGAADALPKLYGRVLTTPQVIAELQMGHFPQLVQRWAQYPPAWLGVRQPTAVEFLDQLDDGEASALSLARECAADLVLIDERAATNVARSLGMRSAGTLAVLQEAGYEGYIDFHAAIRTLTTSTQFRSTPALIAQVVEAYERRVQQRGPTQTDAPKQS